jgi:phosphoribosylformylglycinamidine synthase
MKLPVYRLFVERKKGFENEARRTFAELVNFVGIKNLEGIRYFNRYDIEGVTEEELERASAQIFSEPQSDKVYRETFPAMPNETVIAIEYLPGQYDQRADSAAQCLALLKTGATGTTTTNSAAPTPAIVRCARLFALRGKLSAPDLEKISSYLINPVDSRESASAKPESLAMQTGKPNAVPVIKDFISLDAAGLGAFHKKAGLAMDLADIAFLQSYFKKENRDPTETEIRVLDTYWSDHCRHTTFNTVLENIQIEAGPYAETFRAALDSYSGLRAEIYANRAKPVTLMDMAVIGAKALKRRGLLDDIEESAEINACSIFIDVSITDDSGKTTGKEPWLLMFKNETHNHPTEIEPFGGAATCIGGAIRDPLSGRAWVYQALRVTGAGDPTVPIDKTIPGKLPQIKLTREAAAGFSAYGNQIGLTTGQVVEYYDPGFLAKRMELGAVIAATPVSAVVRE